jgi:hypothetical protein
MNILWHDSAVFELDEAALYYGGLDDELKKNARHLPVRLPKLHLPRSRPDAAALEKLLG